MKKVFYKISSTLVVIGLVILLYFFSGYMQNFEMTEEEAAYLALHIKRIRTR